MIQVVVESLAIEGRFIFIIQKEHNEKYNMKSFLKAIRPNCEVIEISGVTEGAACTTLLAKEFINNDNPLVIANSDQYIKWNASNTMYNMSESKVDGGILTFKATHPKWSYAKSGDDGFVTEVAEKQVISEDATVGVYYWGKGSDYVKYAEDMIQKDIRVNNEFYVCPVFNQAIEDKKKIKVYDVEEMWGLGTPEDLDFYHNHFKN
jgi:dTDP-glucose pyrophosphorylase